MGTHAASNRGLAASLMRGAHDSDPTLGATCHTMIVNAGGELLERARQARAIRPDVAIVDLLKLVSAISLAAEQEPGGGETAPTKPASSRSPSTACTPADGRPDAYAVDHRRPHPG
ncbi:hypothetical protein ACFQX6_22420 [Streptosporangium lutulentum]